MSRRRDPVGIEKRTRLRIRGKPWTHARGVTPAGEPSALPACDRRGRQYDATFDAVSCPYCLEIVRERDKALVGVLNEIKAAFK